MRSKFLSVLLVITMLCTSLFGGSVYAAEQENTTVYDQNGLKVDFKVDSQWDGFLNGTISVTNTGTQTIENWAITFDFPHEISNIWNAAIMEHQPGVYTVKNLTWNQDIPVGGSISFGFTAATTGEITRPTFFVVNTKPTEVASERIKVEYVLYSDWGSGYSSALTITNLSDTTIEDWTIDFDFARSIDNLSCGKLLEHNGTHYTIQNDGDTQNISDGQMIQLGLGGTGGVAADAPTSFVVKQMSLSFDLISDTDGDQVLDWVEICVNGTDPLVPDGLTPSPIPTITPTVSPTPIPDEDVDCDALPDAYEIIIIKHLLLNGVASNGIESVLPSDDYDRDGLSLGQEYEYDTNPFLADSDYDGLTDYDEINVYNTNPIQKDTDRDGMGDGTEVDAGLDPNLPDTNGDGIADSEEIVSQNVRLESVQEIDISQSLVEPSVVITGKGDYSEKLYALMIEEYNGLFDIPSIVGRPFEFVHDSDLVFEESTLTFYISDTALADNNIVDLAIAYYDEESNSLEPIETTYDKSTNTITANVSHYSTYVVINIKALYYQLQSHSNSSENGTIERYEYNGNEYALLNTSLSWDDARDFCVSSGGHLVIINNEEEQAFLTNLMQTYGNKNLYWIGLSGEDEQCSWVDGTPLSYENWSAGEPNSTTETAVHMYCKEQGEFSCGQWNDTYNDYFVGISFFWSTDNCGFICEWEDAADAPQSGFWISLSNGTIVKLDKDPSLGDETVDTDHDGIPDVIELRSIDTSLYNGIQTWTFYSNPASYDSDGDGLSDFEDLYPARFDTRILTQDAYAIVFNTGRTWQIITCNSFDYVDNMLQVIDGHADNPIPSDVFQVILANSQKNSEQKFNLDELTVIGLVNNEGSKLYMDRLSNETREKVFKRLVGRESRYYKHSGILGWENWEEVPKGNEGGFFQGKVLSEADINLSLKVYFICDVYTVLDSLVIIGAIVIVTIVATKATPIIIGNIVALTYYMKNFGILNGLNLWYACGASGLPDGVISFIQVDLADGDSQIDDIVEMVIVADLQDGDSQLDDGLIIAEKLSAELINKKVVLYLVQVDAADGDLVYDDAIFSTYTYMHGKMRGSGLHTHHLIEQRLINALTNAFPDANLTTGKIISTPLNPQAHEAITKLWREILPYGDSTIYTIDQVVDAAQEVYADYPVMLNAVNDWLRSLGATIP